MRRRRPNSNKPLNTGQTGPMLNSNNGEIYYSMGAALYNSGRYEDSIAAYKQAVTLKSDLPDVYSNIGDAYLKLNKYSEAADSYKHAVLLRQADADTYNNLGFVIN